jgi:hypothetical protein
MLSLQENDNPSFEVSKDDLLEKIVFFTKNNYVVSVLDMEEPKRNKE